MGNAIRHALLWAMVIAPLGAHAQTPPIGGAPPALAEPLGDAPGAIFNETGVFDPKNLERLVMETPRDGTLYVTFKNRYTVTSGAASKNMEMDFSFSSIVLRHSGTTPGNANLTLRMVDGRTLFISVRSTARPGDDRYAFIR